MKFRSLFFLLTVLALGIPIGILIGSSSRPSPTPMIVPSPSITPSPSLISVPPIQHSVPALPAGTIEGPLVFPSQSIPSDMKACAVNLASRQETCTRRQIRDGRFKTGVGFQLQVAPGNYQVYSVVPSMDPNYRAYFSRFVVCGYEAGCSDHTPITVSVTAGVVVSNIEPGDFYRT